MFIPIALLLICYALGLVEVVGVRLAIEPIGSAKSEPPLKVPTERVTFNTPGLSISEIQVDGPIHEGSMTNDYIIMKGGNNDLGDAHIIPSAHMTQHTEHDGIQSFEDLTKFRASARHVRASFDPFTLRNSRNDVSYFIANILEEVLLVRPTKEQMNTLLSREYSYSHILLEEYVVVAAPLLNLRIAALTPYNISATMDFSIFSDLVPILRRSTFATDETNTLLMHLWTNRMQLCSYVESTIGFRIYRLKSDASSAGLEEDYRQNLLHLFFWNTIASNELDLHALVQCVLRDTRTFPGHVFEVKFYPITGMAHIINEIVANAGLSQFGTSDLVDYLSDLFESNRDTHLRTSYEHLLYSALRSHFTLSHKGGGILASNLQGCPFFLENINSTVLAWRAYHEWRNTEISKSWMDKESSIYVDLTSVHDSIDMEEDVVALTLWDALYEDLKKLKEASSRSRDSAKWNALLDASELCGYNTVARAMLYTVIRSCHQAPVPDASLAKQIGDMVPYLYYLVTLAGLSVPGSYLDGRVETLSTCLFGNSIDAVSSRLYFLYVPGEGTPMLSNLVWNSSQEGIITVWNSVIRDLTRMSYSDFLSESDLVAFMDASRSPHAMAKWHVSGILNRDRFTTVQYFPQMSYYFATSYFQVQFERTFKSEFHENLIQFMSENTEVIPMDTYVRAIKVANSMGAPTLLPSRAGTYEEDCKNLPKVAVFGSFWQMGHSSHRISAPFAESFASKGCSTLIYSLSDHDVELLQSGLTVAQLKHFSSTNFHHVIRPRIWDHVGDQLGILARLWGIYDNVNNETDESIAGQVQRLIKKLKLSKEMIKARTMPYEKLPPELQEFEDEYLFDYIMYPSIGMTSLDVFLSSFHIARRQLVTYGHSASTYSPAMNYFLGGFDPELIGPFSSNIYQFSHDFFTPHDCSAQKSVLFAVLSQVLRTNEDGKLSTNRDLDAPIISDQSTRYPVLFFCNVTRAEPGVFPLDTCSRWSSYVVVDASRTLGDIDFHDTMALLGGDPQCRANMPVGVPVSHAINKRLVDAQERYRENLLLFPGLGLWFTDNTSGLKQFKKPFAISANLVPTAAALSHVWGRLLDDRVSVVHTTSDFDWINFPGSVLNIADVFSKLPFPGAVSRINDTSSLHSYPIQSNNPVHLGLVWSVVKWNAAHFDRVIVSVREAQLRFKKAWEKCHNLLVRSNDLPEYELESIRKSPRFLVCAEMLQRYPPIIVSDDVFSGPKVDDLGRPIVAEPSTSVRTLVPTLVFRLTSFTSDNANGIEMESSVMRVNRILRNAFPDGSVTMRFQSTLNTLDSYYTALSQVDVIIDSLPFSACNTMQDALTLGIPIVTGTHDNEYESGTSSPMRWRSSIGGSILSNVGLSGLVALDDEEFVDKTSHMLANPFLREFYRHAMANSPTSDISHTYYPYRDSLLLMDTLNAEVRF